MLMLFSQMTIADVRINEFVAKNATTNPDMCDYTDYSDWIELYNSSDSVVDLTGYYLTSNPSKPMKWAIPYGTSIGANDYLLFFCDGYDCTPGKNDFRPYYPYDIEFTTKRFHTNFKLDKDIEFVGLFNESASDWSDSVSYNTGSLADISIGRKPDDTIWYKFDNPTPGSANSTMPKPLDCTDRSPPVEFSIAGGFYNSEQTVTLSAGSGNSIFYTDDGTAPTTESIKYTDPIVINSTTRIRARCIEDDKLPGPLTCNTYFINEKNRKLPVISITTDPALLWDETVGLYTNRYKLKEIPVSLEYFTTDGVQAFSVNAAIGPGTISSYDCPQMPMQVAVKPKYGTDFINYKLFDKPITKFNRLRLRNSGDTWSSNYMADNIVDAIITGHMDVKNQAYAPVVVYLNGEYWGLYDLREDFFPLYFSENFNISDTSSITQIEGTIVGDITDSGLVLNDGLRAVRGSMDEYTSLLSLMDTSGYERIDSIININSFIDYMAMEVYGANSSWGHNCHYWKSSETKWQFLMQDLDRAFDNSIYTLNMFTGGGIASPLIYHEILSKLMNFREFKNLFVQRFAAHAASTFNKSRTTAIIDSIHNMLLPEIPDQVNRWKDDGGLQSLEDWQTAVNDMKNFANERIPFAMNHIKKQFELGGTANLSVNIVDENSGDIYICGVAMGSHLTNLAFFKNIPFSVKAVPRNGFEFVRWEGASMDTTDTTILTINSNCQLTAVFRPVSETIHPVAATGTDLEDVKTCHPGSYGTSINIDYSLASANHVNISLYTISGQKAATLIDSDAGMGKYKKTIYSSHFSSGVYFVKMISGSFRDVKRLVIR